MTTASISRTSASRDSDSAGDPRQTRLAESGLILDEIEATRERHHPADGPSLGRYRLHETLGVGPDGAAYRGVTQDQLWEIRRLDNAHKNPGRWDLLSGRLVLVSLLPPHPAMIPTRVELQQEPPLVALVWSERHPLSTFLDGKDTLSNDRMLVNLAAIADALACAHRYGLTHGSLTTDSIFVEPNGIWTIEFTGVACHRGMTRLAAIDDPYEDIQSLGRILNRVLPLVPGLEALTAGGRHSAGQGFVQASGMEETLRRLAADMMSAEVSDRPLAAEIAQRLLKLSDQFRHRSQTPTMENDGDAPKALRLDLDVANADMTAIGEEETLGRFRLQAKLGEGGMGTVYRAIDERDGSTVAVKLLNSQRASSPMARRRFIKEGRMLAKIQSPHVTQLIDVNEENGRCYLVMEFVQGRNLSQWLDEYRKLDEKKAVAIIADVARGLSAAHTRRIIHRDVKPDNILIVETDDRLLAKITDFGLAREVVQSESLQITRAGTILGTPLYMAPEQFSGSEEEDPRTDVYALGATLFHMLAGRTPYVGKSFQDLLVQHTTAEVPDLAKFASGVSGSIVEIVTRSMQKRPADRYPDADALLRDLALAMRGEPTSHQSHPQMPQLDSKKIASWEFRWELESSPAQLWPYVSNTERVNRAMGLPAIEYSVRPREQGGTRRRGSARIVGMKLSWEEHPFEWIEGKRMGVLREFASGPFKWFWSTIDFRPRADGGTTLIQTIRIEPRGLIGRAIGAIEFGIKTRRSLTRIYRQIDETLKLRKTGDALTDPFDRPTQLPAVRQQRLWAAIPELVAAGIAADAADCLGLYLSNASDQEAARIRPLAIARRFNVDPDEMVAACLRAVPLGLLVLRWDVLCPLCQIASTKYDTLQAIKEHEHCPACNVEFAADLNVAIEMVFYAHPDIRTAEFGNYCAGGPSHSPHVVAQTRVAPGERMELSLNMPAGSYRLRGPQLPWTLDLEVSSSGAARQLEVSLNSTPDPKLIPTLLPDGQTLVLDNSATIELIARVERIVQKSDAVTAARATAMPLFRELFPGEILAPNRLSQIASISVLMTQIADGASLFAKLGDANAYTLIQRSFETVGKLVREHQGVVVKTVSEGILAVFTETVQGAKAAIDLQAALAADPATRSLKIRASLHRGLATVAAHDGVMEYFGATIKETIKLLELAGPGDLVIADGIAIDPEVDALIRSRGLMTTLKETRGLQPNTLLLARQVALPTAV